MNALAIFGFSLLVAAAPVSGSLPSENLMMAQAADCYTMGEEQAYIQGGTLATASDAVQNGQPVCRVIVLVPGKNGERPKRVEIIVPKA